MYQTELLRYHLSGTPRGGSAVRPKVSLDQASQPFREQVHGPVHEPCHKPRSHAESRTDTPASPQPRAQTCATAHMNLNKTPLLRPTRLCYAHIVNA
jgi:hypothetical protein